MSQLADNDGKSRRRRRAAHEHTILVIIPFYQMEEDVNCRERSINRENKKRAIRHLDDNISTEDIMIDGTRSTAQTSESKWRYEDELDPKKS